MRLVFQVVVISIFNILFTPTNSFSQDTESIQSNKNKIMFSSRIQQNTKQLSKQILFVVKNDECFLVKFNNGKYLYEKPEDKCYELENQLNICVEQGKIAKINGQHHNVYKNGYKPSSRTLNDWFYQESTTECNEMKFDIIKKFFLDDKEITYIQYQLYLLNYFDIIRLIIFENQDDNRDKEENTKKSNLLAFTITYSNEIGCSIYDKFKIYELKEDKDKKNKKKNRKKQQTQKKGRKFEETEKFNEIFKKLALKNTQYLKPINSNYIDNDTVIVLNNNTVEKISIALLDINWKKTNGKNLLKTDTQEQKQNQRKQR